ncbi:MAG: hypothetical protein IKS35_07570, partial [Clostridia bacterium]|nr:hypothetical protein [Clostridia bacterium]
VPVIIPIDEEQDEDETELVATENGYVGIRYNRSFLAKLIQSDDELKERYSILKNELLSYGATCRMSWTNESFRVSRPYCAKFAIRGKTLSLFLALHPSDYDDTKYIYDDFSDVKRYEGTPMRLKLRSDRSVRWAIELIAEMMEQLGKEKQEDVVAMDYRLPYEPTPPLIKRDLIRIVGGTPEEVQAILDEADEFEDPSLNKSFMARLIQSSDEVKQRYSMLKNEIMSYGASNRVSWNNDSFRVSRPYCAKFAIRGKTLSLFLALNPAEFEETKYIYDDFSDVKKYAGTPMRLKLRSDRSARWACDLIAIMMEKFGKTKVSEENVDYVMPYEDNDPLIVRGWIKRVGDNADAYEAPEDDDESDEDEEE